jgi:hypothetical protein
VGIFTVFNLLYFTNSIPPIPLALKSAGVYHSILRDLEGSYVGQAEQTSWQERFSLRTSVYHHKANEPIYFYSAIFAPIELTQPIYHEWQYFDKAQDEWVTSTRVTFPIVGGRERGYRAYSTKTAISPGRWRVLVATGRGQLLGRTTFVVEFVETPISLEERVL